MAPPPIDISKVTGNAPDKVKNVLSDLRFFGYDLDDNGHHKRFGNNVFAGMWLAEVSSTTSDEEPSKNEVKAAFGVVVDESMLNGLTTLHGGCSAFMIDL
ncbi:hypothetical protein CPB85DRAFT_1335358 [Mucidula mucida]|nr:hypothetical protein CPB85DRAFT_1335358 [Mucidula mucida]